MRKRWLARVGERGGIIYASQLDTIVDVWMSNSEMLNSANELFRRVVTPWTMNLALAAASLPKK